MNTEVDGWMSTLMDCKHLKEVEVQELCTKVSRFIVFLLLFSRLFASVERSFRNWECVGVGKRDLFFGWSSVSPTLMFFRLG